MLEDSLITLLPCPGAMCCPIGSLYAALVLDAVAAAVLAKVALLSGLQLASLDSSSVAFGPHAIALGASAGLLLLQIGALVCLSVALAKRRPRLLLPFAAWKGAWTVALAAFAVGLFFEARLGLFGKLKYALGSTEAEELFYILNRRKGLELADFRNVVLLPLAIVGVLANLWAFVVALRAQGALAAKGGERRGGGEEEEVLYRHYEDTRLPLQEARREWKIARPMPPPPYNPTFDARHRPY